MHAHTPAGIAAIPMPAEDIADEERMIARLRAGRADAIVMDSNWVRGGGGHPYASGAHPFGGRAGGGSPPGCERRRAREAGTASSQPPNPCAAPPRPQVEYMAGTQCDLIAVGQPWGEKFVAYQININAQQPLIDDIDA